MGLDVFISHSSTDKLAADAACAALEADGIRCWIAPRDILQGSSWATAILKAIADCRLMVLVFSAAANESEYVQREVGLAVDRGIPIAPLRIQDVKATGELKFHLHRTHWMDALPPPLDQHLRQLASNVRALLETSRALTTAAPPEPPAGQARTTPAPMGTCVINGPPAEPPAHFQHRAYDALVGRWLQDPSCRLILLCGRGGTGKTTLACRLLKELERPDPDVVPSFQATLYLGPQSRALSFANLFGGLCQLVGADARHRLESLYADPKPGADAKTRALLSEFSTLRVVVLLDNFEDVLDPGSFTVADPELAAALRTLLETGRHGVTAVVTSRFTPRDLVRIQSGRQKSLEMEDGLGPAEAAAMLREMDPDGHLGLRDAAPQLLEEARRRTDGNPRALELIKGILAADMGTNLKEVLAADLPPDLAEVLIGEAFRRLSRTEQAVLQAMAVYSTPLGPAATPEAIDFLLAPFVAKVESRPVLGKLVHLRLVSRNRASGLYSMREADAAYALSQVVPGEPASHEDAAGETPFTLRALFHRAADWFRGRRVAEGFRKTRDDLTAHLLEFEFRAAGGEYDAASSVLSEIDFDDLIKWGMHRSVIDLRERLEGHLSRYGERRYNASILGICYARLGQLDDAVRFHERALAIARETGPPEAEAAELANLGYCRLETGQTQAALRLFGESLEMARVTADRYREGVALSNIGCCHTNLGNSVAAEEHHRPALQIAVELGHRRDEANRLCNLARCRLDERRFADAAVLAAEAASAAAESNDPGGGVEAQRALAWAYFSLDDLVTARLAADAAREHDVHATDYRASLVLGVVALWQGDPAAPAAFRATIERADIVLSRCNRLFAAQDARGLSFCGLAVCENGKGQRWAQEAAAAFRIARTHNPDAGVVSRVLNQLDAIAGAGAATAVAMLAGARDAAARGM